MEASRGLRWCQQTAMMHTHTETMLFTAEKKKNVKSNGYCTISSEERCTASGKLLYHGLSEPLQPRPRVCKRHIRTPHTAAGFTPLRSYRAAAVDRLCFQFTFCLHHPVFCIRYTARSACASTNNAYAAPRKTRGSRSAAWGLAGQRPED